MYQRIVGSQLYGRFEMRQRKVEFVGKFKNVAKTRLGLCFGCLICCSDSEPLFSLLRLTKA